jgi:hypothetical protein
MATAGPTTFVTPAKAGVQRRMDSGFRRNDVRGYALRKREIFQASARMTS